ncbi:AMP-binding protein [bacterium]|nr:AMP-binding protein [candidate division CSSED10-310 bacterium]
MKINNRPMKDMPVFIDEQLRKYAELVPQKTVIFYDDRKYSYRDLARDVDILAEHLRFLGLQNGDRVVIAMHRRPEIIVAFIAISKAGGIAVPLDFKLSLKEIDEIRRLTDPIGTIFSKDLKSQIGSIKEGEWRLEIEDSTTFASFSEQVAPLSERERLPEDLVYLNFTSGSTAKPKAAMATHKQLFYNTLASCEVFKINENDIHLPLFAVMSHPHEIFYRAILTGGSIALVDNLYPRSIARAITKYKVTCVMAVSPVYELLIPFAGSTQYDFRSLRLPESGGMATPAWLQERFKDSFGVPIFPVWGSTETMGIAFASELNGITPRGSVGRILPFYDSRIVDSKGNEVSEGEVGELLLRGSAITDGYWRAEDETRRVFEDGWYATGDLFHVDEQGYYFYHGRKDTMVKVGGMKVYPAEIEAVLYTHALIREAVVVPFQDRLRGVVPLAAVVVEPGEMLTEAQLRQFLKDKLARFKIPRIIRFLPDLPRTSGGKVDRKALTTGVPSPSDSPELTIQRRIEAIDLKILHLLNERLKLLMDIKDSSKISTFKPDQIQETIQRLQEFNPGPLHDTFVEQLFRLILSIPQYL